MGLRNHLRNHDLHLLDRPPAGSHLLAFRHDGVRRLYRETGWVFPKGQYLPRSVTEVLRVFDLMKNQFGGKPPGR